MRHRNTRAKFGRKKAPRAALIRNLAESLILSGSIRTTVAKAKVLRSLVEPLITKARRGDLTARRNLMKILYTDAAVNKLMVELGPKYKGRAGGYTRITKLGPRANDAAKMARIEFV